VTLGLRHAAERMSQGVPATVASTEGYVPAFRIGAVLLIIGGILALVLLEHVSARPRSAVA